jgi:integrase
MDQQREDVKNQLGHSSIVLTSNTYGHVLEQRQRQVARAMDAVLGGDRRSSDRSD